jgi:hypothetical protein
MRRAILVRRTLLLLGELHDFSLGGQSSLGAANGGEGSGSGSGASTPSGRERRRPNSRSSAWPPSGTEMTVTDVELADQSTPWMWKRVPDTRGGRKGMKWVQLRAAAGDGGGFSGGSPAGSEDGEEVLLLPGTREHLLWTLRAGFQMFKEYSVGVDKATVVLTTMCHLYDAVVSRRCLTYRLGARRKVDGRLVPLPVDEYILTCIVQCGMARNAEAAKISHFWGLWRLVVRGLRRSREEHEGLGVGPAKSAVSWGSQSEERRVSVAKSEAAADHDDQKWLDVCSKKCLRIDTAQRSRRLRLLIEWNQPQLVAVMLHEDDEVSVGLLDECLQHAVVHDRCGIAITALDLGASTGCYSRFDSKKVWVCLLTAASEAPEERHLLALIREGARLAGLSVENATDITSDNDAIRILDRVYELLALGEDRLPVSFSRQATAFHFTHDENGVWAGADFNLFMCMLLMNRGELAHLFFAREGRQNAASLLPNALWACLLCRRLSRFEGVGTDSYHLRNGFEVRRCSPPCNVYVPPNNLLPRTIPFTNPLTATVALRSPTCPLINPSLRCR